MASRFLISRRTALKGLGVAMALPLFEQMGVAADPKGAARAPVRMAFIHFGMGVIADHWKFGQGAAAKGAEIPGCFLPVKAHLNEMLVLGGLKQQAATGGADGAGDHAREAGTFLTGTRLRKTSGKDIYNGISVDQLAAQKIGGYTNLPSIELSMEGGSGSGDCDSGYSCAYSTNISWRSPTTPMAKETNPRSAFMRLFADRGQSSSAQAQAALAAENRSLLDLVNEDAGKLKGSLGGNDGRKLEEYLDSVRALEGRIQKISGHEDEAAGGAKTDLKLPSGIPGDFAEHARLMFDIMTVAFQTDTTRIATFMLTNGGSGRTYKEIGVTGGHHELSHHGNDQAKIDGIRKINVYHMTQFAYFLEKLKGVKEGKGTLLDNSMIMYGSCIGDGDRHNHDDLPIVLAGGGGGTIKSGRVVPSCRGNLCDLYLAMLGRMGVEAASFGDSTKALPDLV
jgi:hypothetical protein